MKPRRPSRPGGPPRLLRKARPAPKERIRPSGQAMECPVLSRNDPATPEIADRTVRNSTEHSGQCNAGFSSRCKLPSHRRARRRDHHMSRTAGPVAGRRQRTASRRQGLRRTDERPEHLPRRLSTADGTVSCEQVVLTKLFWRASFASRKGACWMDMNPIHPPSLSVGKPLGTLVKSGVPGLILTSGTGNRSSGG